MAKRKQIVKLLEKAENDAREDYTEGGTVDPSNFELGIIFGLMLAKQMIKNKRDKEHGF